MSIRLRHHYSVNYKIIPRKFLTNKIDSLFLLEILLHCLFHKKKKSPFSKTQNNLSPFQSTSITFSNKLSTCSWHSKLNFKKKIEIQQRWTSCCKRVIREWGWGKFSKGKPKLMQHSKRKKTKIGKATTRENHKTIKRRGKNFLLWFWY